MQKKLLSFTVMLLLSVLTSTEVFGQLPQVQRKPPRNNNTTTKPTKKPTTAKPPKKPTSSTRIPQPLLDLEANMVFVEGGTFTMGSKDYYDSDELKPAHRVSLSSFSISKYEVTQALWELVMGSNPSSIKGAKYPVDMVSWEDCQTFITKLNQLTGKQYRLPTEAEWEYAARGGNRSNGYKYAGSDNIDDVAWYRDNSGSQMHDVGTKRANELGLYDMSGNVFEFCNDWFGSYSSGSQTNPLGPSSGTYRVVRGGSGTVGDIISSVSFRLDLKPTVPNNHVGFRLAL